MKRVLGLVVLMLAGTANAGMIGLGDFSGSETIIDFNAISNTQSITNQYSGDGVDFSGALVGLTNPGDTNLFNGSTIASNWIYSGTGNTGSSWTATFSSVQNLVGFLAETNSSDSVTIEAFLGLTSIGSVNFPNPNGPTPDFLGFGDLGGFDSITVTTANIGNGFFAMDDFRFEGSSVSVPEPGSLVLLALGLVGLRFSRGN